MIAWVLRALILVHVLALELVANARLGGYAPDLSALIVLYAALHLHVRSALLLLFVLSVPRSLLQPGALHAHLWLLFGVLVLLRSAADYLFHERWYWQMALAGLAAGLLAAGQAWLFGGGAGDPMQRGVLAVVLTAVIGPGFLLLLAAFCRGLTERDARVRRTEPAR